MVWCFVYSFFGLLIGFRTIDFLRTHQIYESRFQLRLNLLIVIFVFASEKVFSGHLSLQIVVLMLLWFLPAIALAAQERRRRFDFEKNILSYLDSILISLQVGRSFREAVSDLVASQVGPGRFYLHELNSLLQFSNNERAKSKSTLFEEVLHEFLSFNRSSHRVYDQVKALRRKIGTCQAFQKKSGQVTLQVRAQSLILVILFLALFFYTLLSFDFHKTQKILAVAAVMFIVGTWANFKIPRRFKWKV